MKILSTIIVIGITLSLTGATVFSSEHERHEGSEYKHEYKYHKGYESKLYGTVERIPKGIVGTWIVNGREILITKNTKIEEEYGKAEVGAYVEIEGYYPGKNFIAHEIEVKRAKR